MTVPSSRTREHDWRAYLATSRTDLAVYGYVALYLMLLYIGPRTPSWLSFTNGLYFVMGVITLVAQVIAARSTTLEIRDRRAWAWLAASSVVLLINGLTWTLELERGESTRLTDPLEVVVSLLSIVGLLYFPADRRVHLRDRRVQLDGALLLTAWLAMFWVFGLRTELNNSTAPLIERIGGLLSTWPEIGLAALVYLRAGNHPRRRAIALHFGALVTSAISVFIWNELRGFYLPGHWVDGAWFLAWVLRWRAARTAVLVTPGHAVADGLSQGVQCSERQSGSRHLGELDGSGRRLHRHQHRAVAGPAVVRHFHHGPE